MICNLCGKHNATVYFKGMVNDQTLKLHLCDACAKKKGMVFPFGKSIASLGDMIAGLAKSTVGTQNLYGVNCAVCGLSYAEFKQTSQFGCSRCFATFAPLVAPLLKRLHGSAQHMGKTAPCTVRQAPPVERLARLKVELKTALQNEAYETAAQIRDQIRTLEGQMTGKS